MTRIALSAAAALVLVSCAPMPPQPDTDACGASGYEGLVGSPLAAVTLPADLDARIIGPDDVVTMDYRQDRLNIMLDEGGTITRVYCG